MNKNLFFEYLRTVSITFLVALSLVFAVIWLIKNDVFEEEARKEVKENTIDYYLVNVYIEKNKYLEEQNPADFRINLKLGELYEIKKQYKDAENEYIKAINKSPYGEHKARYKLSLLYAELDRLEEAQNLMDSVGEKPNKRLIRYKAEVYNQLGDKYFNKAEYDDACAKYKKALSYYTILKSKKEKTVKGNLASSYMYLAEEKLNQLQLQEAIDYLMMAKSIINAPLIKYKLALLLIPQKPDLAYSYFDEVFREAPEIINYETYNKFLSVMAQEAEADGNITLANLYEYKIKKLTEYHNKTIIQLDEFYLDFARGDIKADDWNWDFRPKYDLKVELCLRNISRFDINSLFVHIEFLDKDKIVSTHVQQIIDLKTVLKPEDTSPIINISTSIDKTPEDKYPKELTARIFLSKAEKSYRILLTEIKIKEKPKKKGILNYFS